jgi:hypothetical protein
MDLDIGILDLIAMAGWIFIWLGVCTVVVYLLELVTSGRKK